MDTLLTAGCMRESWQERANRAGLQRAPLGSTKDNARPPETTALALVKPAREEPKDSRVHAHGAVSITLAVADRQNARSNVEIPSLESESLGDPQTSTIEGGDQGAVCAGRSVLGEKHPQECTSLLRSKDVRGKCISRMSGRLSCAMTRQGGK